MRGHAAVHRDLGAGDERGVVAEQKGDQRRDFVDGAGAPKPRPDIYLATVAALGVSADRIVASFTRVPLALLTGG